MSPTLKSALWMIGSIVSFSSMAIAGRTVSSQLDTFEIMMYRSFIGILIVLAVAFVGGTQGQINLSKFRLHLVRNLAHFTGQNLWFFALPLIPLAQVFALEFTTPLWVLMLSPLVLSERMTKMRSLSAVIGFIGIMIVARPGATPINAGLLTAAACAVAFSFSIMFTKKLTYTESITCILFFLTTMQAVFGIICAGYDGDIMLPTVQTLPWLLVIGCTGLLGHFCLTTALSIAPATVVVPMDFVRLPVIAIVGMLLYHEPLDIWIFVGAVLIFGANYMNIWWETRKAVP